MVWKSSAINLTIKAISAGSIFGLYFILEKEEYAKFGIYYAILTGVVAFSQSGLFELGASARDSSEITRSIYLKSLILRLLDLFFKSSAALFLTGLILVIVKSNFMPYGIVFFALSIGIIFAAGNTLANLFRLTDDITLGVTVLVMFIALSSVGFLVGARAGHTAQSSIQGAAIIGFVSIFSFYLFNFRKIIFFQKIKLLAKKNTTILIDYTLISVFGWLAGYGMNLFIYFILTTELVAEYFLIYSSIAAMGLITASINNSWAPRFIFEHHNNPDRAARKNRKIFLIELLIVTVLSLVILFIAIFLKDYNKSKSAVIIWKNIEYIGLSLATITISIPWWCIQNYYTRDGISGDYKRLVLSSSFVGLATWISLIYFFKIDGLYIGLFLNSAIKTILFIKGSKSLYPVDALLSESTIASSVIIIVGYCIHILF